LPGSGAVRSDGIPLEGCTVLEEICEIIESLVAFPEWGTFVETLLLDRYVFIGFGIF